MQREQDSSGVWATLHAAVVAFILQLLRYAASLPVRVHWLFALELLLHRPHKENQGIEVAHPRNVSDITPAQDDVGHRTLL